MSSGRLLAVQPFLTHKLLEDQTPSSCLPGWIQLWAPCCRVYRPFAAASDVRALCRALDGRLWRAPYDGWHLTADDRCSLLRSQHNKTALLSPLSSNSSAPLLGEQTSELSRCAAAASKACFWHQAPRVLHLLQVLRPAQLTPLSPS